MHGLHPSTLVLTLASLLTLVTSLPQPESHQARAPQMGHSNDHDSSTFTDAPVSYAQINFYYGGTNDVNGCDGVKGKRIGTRGPLTPGQITGFPVDNDHPNGATAMLWAVGAPGDPQNGQHFVQGQPTPVRNDGQHMVYRCTDHECHSKKPLNVGECFYSGNAVYGFYQCPSDDGVHCK